MREIFRTNKYKLIKNRFAPYSKTSVLSADYKTLETAILDLFKNQRLLTNAKENTD